MNYVESGYVRSGYIRRDSDTLAGISFDTYGKQVFIAESVAKVDLSEVCSRGVDWVAQDENSKFNPPMRYSGYDPIPGSFTGATYFMTNGWKLVFNPNTTAISGVLFSEDYDTGYWAYNGLPIFPITVAATVNTVFRETGISGLTEEESAKLMSLLNTDLTATDAAIAEVKVDTGDTLVDLTEIRTDISNITSTSPQEVWEYGTRELTAASSSSLTQEEHDKLMETATTVDTVVASQL